MYDSKKKKKHGIRTAFLTTVTRWTVTDDAASADVRFLPNKIGKNSLYVMCWMTAMTNFRASWYSISSFHCGFSDANSVTKKLCSRNRATCDTAMSGCWFTRPSPKPKRTMKNTFSRVLIDPGIFFFFFIARREGRDYTVCNEILTIWVERQSKAIRWRVDDRETRARLEKTVALSFVIASIGCVVYHWGRAGAKNAKRTTTIRIVRPR